MNSECVGVQVFVEITQVDIGPDYKVSSLYHPFLHHIILKPRCISVQI